MEDRAEITAQVFSAIARIAECRTPQEVGQVLTEAMAPFGLTNYAIGGMPTPADPNPTGFMYHNWPEAWQQCYFDRNFSAIDPVPRAARIMSMPLTIGELRQGRAGFVPGPECDDYFAQASHLASDKGLIVPIAGPQGYHGIAVLAGAEDFGPEDRARLHMLALYAHGRLLDLHGAAQDQGDGALTQREIEVLRLARAGLADEDVGRHLGISTRTVRFHFENAKRKLNVRTRAEALVTAVGRHLLGS